jgi:hypothetical protein
MSRRAYKCNAPKRPGKYRSSENTPSLTLMNRPKIHRRFIRLLYNLALAGPLPLKVLSRQMASLLVRARSFGTRKGAKLLHPGPNGPAARRGAGDVSQGIMRKIRPTPVGDPYCIGPGLCTILYTYFREHYF